MPQQFVRTGGQWVEIPAVGPTSAQMQAAVDANPTIAYTNPGAEGAPGQFVTVGPAGPTWLDEPVHNVRHPRFGAVGDGVADDTAEINAALALGGHVLIPDGTYKISGLLSATQHNTTVTLSPGTTILATTSNAVFYANAVNNFVLNGNGATVNLNGIARRGVVVQGSAATPVTGAIIRDILVRNLPTVPTAIQGAVDIRYATAPHVDHVRVEDYGSLNTSGTEVFAFFGSNLTNARYTYCDADTAYIGFDFDACSRVQLDHCTASNITDNGIYVLSGCDDITITGGGIYGAEEGVVVLSPNVKMLGMTIDSCTNKGVALRNADYAKIADCTFTNCTLSIGDDGSSTVSDHVQISGNSIVNQSGQVNSILITALTDSEIVNNDIYHPGDTSSTHVIRLNGAIRVKVNGNRLVSQNGTATAVRYSGGCDACEASYNTIRDMATGVQLFTSGSGPSNTMVVYNHTINVTSPYVASGGLTGNKHVPIP